MKAYPKSIIDLSSLTEIQVETLRIELARRKHEITMQEALKTRKISGISRGAHHRVLLQAKANVKAALFTLAVAVHLGVLNLEEAQKLILSASSIPDDLDSNKTTEILGLVNVLAERIVMSNSAQQT